MISDFGKELYGSGVSGFEVLGSRRFGLLSSEAHQGQGVSASL